MNFLVTILSKDGGIVLYWYLNPPNVFKGCVNSRSIHFQNNLSVLVRFSFLAFNEFPEHLLHQEISWTAPILTNNLPAARFQAWVIIIKKLTIHLVAGNKYKEQGGYEDRDLVMDFGTDGERFLIDTGTSDVFYPSSSFNPADTVRRHSGCGTTTLTPEASHVLQEAFDEGTPYLVPEWVDLKNTTMEFTFSSGKRRDTDIVFATRAHRFLCDKYRHGLVWPTPREEPEPAVRCILGLVRRLYNLYIDAKQANVLGRTSFTQ